MDSNVGIVRQLTFEPNVTSTRGYITPGSKKNVNKETDVNLFSCSELLTPLGVQHDDPDRTSMSAFKQTKYMVPIEGSTPVLIGNKVESVIPYIMSDEFVVDAKNDGQVIERTDDYVVVKYKDGTNYAIDIGTRIKKNSSGFWIQNDLFCDLKVGDKFKKGDILAYNKAAFSPNKDDHGVSMNLGVLTKIAVISNWDIFEDSIPITQKLANELATNMIWEKSVVLEPGTDVDFIVKKGDSVETGQSMMKFTRGQDEEVDKFLAAIKEENKEEIIEDTKSSIPSKYTGTIADIKIYTTVPVEDLSPSLQKIVKSYQSKVDKKNKTLDKYKNAGDMNYYKAGQMISEVSEVMKPGSNGKVQGEYVDKGVIIKFYVKYRDIAAKGDKVVQKFALKGVISHVIDEGWEPYSEYRPDEEVSTLVAPLAIAARKVPSIFLDMFGNKVLIELKRQLRDIYYG